MTAKPEDAEVRWHEDPRSRDARLDLKPGQVARFLVVSACLLALAIIAKMVVFMFEMSGWGAP